jgi:hypothetical protein
MSDLVERLVGVAEFVGREPRAVLYEAVKEIERLRSLTRFQDGVIRSGDVACLTTAEREAIAAGLGALERLYEYSPPISQPIYEQHAPTLRALLERTK